MHDLSLYLLELLENSVRSGARHIDVSLSVDQAADELRLTVDDDGQGLKASAEQTLDPFYTTKTGKKTGLGLSLLKGEAELAGGGLKIGPSTRLGGVRVEVWMQLDSVDRPPLGDVATTLMVMGATNRDTVFSVSLSGDEFQPALIEAPLAEAIERLARHTDRQRIVQTYPPEIRDKEVQSMTDDTERKDHACTCCEEASEEELLARLDDVIERYKDKPGALIPVLQMAQGIFGYLPESALKRVAIGMGKPYSEVTGVVSFYSFFSTVPRGRNLVRVCLGTACYVRGGMAVLESLKKALGIDVGETTEDREFSLEVARCFGACGLAPVITINDIVHHRVKPARINDILAQYAPEAEAVGVGERNV